MKKSLLVMSSLMVVCLLVACGTKDSNEWWLNLVNNTIVNEGNNVSEENNVNEENDVDSLEDLIEKTPLTLEDLDRINKYKFPVSYTYVTYDLGGWDSNVQTWGGVYSNNKFLLPIEEDIESKEIISSLMNHDRVYTTMSVVLKNGESYSVEYINDPDTLEYVWASVITPEATTSYTFNY